MASRIEDYGFISDNQTVALGGKDGSIDWLCVPPIDSGAWFAALLGDQDNGRFRIRPTADDARVSRRYRDGTLILETEFSTNAGVVRVIDFMPQRSMHQVDRNPGEARVEQHAGRLHGEELRLGSRILGPLVTLEAPPAVEEEAGGDRDDKGNDHREHRPHDKGGERPVDRGVEQGRTEADHAEAQQLPEQLAPRTLL